MIDDRKLRDWLLPRLNGSSIMTRIGRLEDMCEEFAEKPAAKLTDDDLRRIWVEVSNGVSDLPSTSGNLENADQMAILRTATRLAQNFVDAPGTRLIKLHRFFKENGETYSQLAHYVRAVALFDPANAPTVTTYRGFAGKILEALGYTGLLTSWEMLIQNGDDASLNAAFHFAFDLIRRVLPGADPYAQSVGLELVPGYIKEQLARK